MRILDKLKFLMHKNENDIPDITIRSVADSEKTDKISLFTRGILIVLLGYGALGGFLSAYDISYNKMAVFGVIAATAFLLSAAYESGKSWLMNCSYIGIIIFYIMVGVRKFWYINSGYHAVINIIQEEARNYLGMLSGTEYAENISNQYETVTYFALFISVLIVVLLNIRLSYKISFAKIFFLTFTVFVVPMYFELVPDTIYMICLLTGYGAVLMISFERNPKKRGKVLKYVLLIAMIVSVVLVKLTEWCMPQFKYKAFVPDNENKLATEEKVSDVVLFGLAALIFNGQSNAGVSGGRLTGISTLRPDYETDLVVRFTPYDMGPLYLKAYTGIEYDENSWYSSAQLPDKTGYAADKITGDIDKYEYALTGTVQALEDNYNNEEECFARGIMEVINVGASPAYEYYPYYSAAKENLEYKDVLNEPEFVQIEIDDLDNTGQVVLKDGKKHTYNFYPMLTDIFLEAEEQPQMYLKVADDCSDAVEKICVEAGFSGTADEIADQIIAYMAENYTYSLRPGYMSSREDFVSYFLLDNKKGYCAHFASSATMMFRQMGIPARYVEGYAISYQNIITDGKMLEDVSYSDYYDGYSAIGETALISLEVPDANAHAWVEIYIEGKGWIVIDPTPAAMPESTDSFWDVFRRFSDSAEQIEDDEEDGESGIAGYIEKSFGYIINIIMSIILVTAVVLLLRNLLLIRKKTKMSAKDKAVLAYQRLLTEDGPYTITDRGMIREYILKIREVHNIEEVDEELADRLYDAFFGPQLSDEEYAALEKKLTTIRKMQKSRHFRNSSGGQKS